MNDCNCDELTIPYCIGILIILIVSLFLKTKNIINI